MSAHTRPRLSLSWGRVREIWRHEGPVHGEFDGHIHGHLSYRHTRADRERGGLPSPCLARTRTPRARRLKNPRRDSLWSRLRRRAEHGTSPRPAQPIQALAPEQRIENPCGTHPVSVRRSRESLLLPKPIGVRAARLVCEAKCGRVGQPTAIYRQACLGLAPPSGIFCCAQSAWGMARRLLSPGLVALGSSRESAQPTRRLP